MCTRRPPKRSRVSYEPIWHVRESHSGSWQQINGVIGYDCIGLA